MRLPVDLRSDTVTLPTEQMLEAMRNAPLGDDVFGEDPTVNRLEELAAERLGKEAALLVTSGTQGNLIALLVHTRRGDEVIMEQYAHPYLAETGGLAVVGGLMTRLLPSERGCPDPAAIEAAIRPDDQHHPRTGLICLENTHNRHGGTVITPAELAAVRRVADRHGLPIHLDGARIFNAAVALGVDVRELTKDVDSVTFCLSKGLSAPVGSVLCGSRAFIAEARRMRKMLGGGMRQAGVIAAAGIVALETMVDRLAEDHACARRLGEGLARLPGLKVDLERVVTNMVYVDTSGLGLSAAEWVARLRARQVLGHVTGPTRVRLVTHYGIGPEEIDYALNAAEEVGAAA